MKLVLGKRRFNGIKNFLVDLSDGELPCTSLSINIPEIIACIGAPGTGSDLYSLKLAAQAIRKGVSVVFIDRCERKEYSEVLEHACKTGLPAGKYSCVAGMEQSEYALDSIRAVVAGDTPGVVYCTNQVTMDYVGLPEHRYNGLKKIIEGIHAGASRKIDNQKNPVLIVAYDLLNHVNAIANRIPEYFQRSNNLDLIKDGIESVASQGRSLNIGFVFNEQNGSSEHLNTRTCRTLLDCACKVDFNIIHNQSPGDALVFLSLYARPYFTRPVIVSAFR